MQRLFDAFCFLAPIAFTLAVMSYGYKTPEAKTERDERPE